MMGPIIKLAEAEEHWISWCEVSEMVPSFPTQVIQKERQVVKRLHDRIGQVARMIHRAEAALVRFPDQGIEVHSA